jgi:hypothetical protein
MMNFISRSPNPFDHVSHVWHESSMYRGVRFATRQISLSGRIELTRRIQDLIFKNDFLRAGDSLEQAQASMADLLARRVYLEWGISEIEGLTIDGSPASVQDAIEQGPERLCEEMAAAIQGELNLSEAERKNF